MKAGKLGRWKGFASGVVRRAEAGPNVSCLTSNERTLAALAGERYTCVPARPTGVGSYRTALP